MRVLRRHPILALVSLLTVLEVVLVALPFRATSPTWGGACPDVTIIGVRATRERLDKGQLDMGGMVSAVAYKLSQELWRRQPSLAVKREGVPYPASLVYGPSRNRGATLLMRMMRSEVARCPQVHFALIGLSQGADVIESMASRAPELSSTTKRIAAIVLYGDPSRLPNQSFERGTRDDRGGVFAHSHRSIPAYLVPKTWAFCLDGDEICANHLGLLALIWSGTHTRYADDGNALQQQGIIFAAEQVIQSSRRSPLGQTRGGTGPATTSRLVVRGALGGPRRSTPGLRPGRLDTTQMGPGAGSHT